MGNKEIIIEDSDIIRAVKERLGYLDSPSAVCENCKHVEYTSINRVTCNLNPVFTFAVDPGGTCDWFKSNKMNMKF